MKMEAVFDDEIFRCYIMESPNEKFFEEFRRHIENDKKFFEDNEEKISDAQEIIDGLYDVEEIPDGTKFLAVYDSKNEFVGKIHIFEIPSLFQLNAMQIYASGERRRNRLTKSEKFTKSSFIIWSFVGILAATLYGKFARILIPYPRSIVRIDFSILGVSL